MSSQSATQAARLIAADPAGIAQAATILRAGGLVAIPTETVYGLACDAARPDAVARLFAAKGRPSFNPLIVHVLGLDEAARLGRPDARAEALAARFWPGPLTLVLPRRAEAPLAAAVTAGLETVAVRAPAHPVARALLTASGLALAAPSANRSGRVSPTAPLHVADDLGDRVDLILAAGRTAHGIESTVVALDGPEPVLLRPGAVTREALEAVLGPLADPAPGDPERPSSPGQLARHYAPNLPLRLDAHHPHAGEAYLGFGPGPAGAANLSPSGDLAEAAANLFFLLHKLDRGGASGIAVAPIPHVGLGIALNDRLARAARR